MAKTVKITTDNRISVVEVPWDVEAQGEMIGADCTETVKTRRMYDLFKDYVRPPVFNRGLRVHFGQLQHYRLRIGPGCFKADCVLVLLLVGVGVPLCSPIITAPIIPCSSSGARFIQKCCAGQGSRNMQKRAGLQSVMTPAR